MDFITDSFMQQVALIRQKHEQRATSKMEYISYVYVFGRDICRLSTFQ
jgi:hypothetical protein